MNRRFLFALIALTVLSAPAVRSAGAISPAPVSASATAFDHVEAQAAAFERQADAAMPSAAAAQRLAVTKLQAIGASDLASEIRKLRPGQVAHAGGDADGRFELASITLKGAGSAGSVLLAPAINNVLSVAGDSWTEGNEAKQSRLGTGLFTQTDRWDNQLATLLGVTNYTTPGQTGVTDGVINVGYGGQTSATIYTNVDAIITAEAARLQNTWTWFAGRNNTSSDAQVGNITTKQGEFITRITHDRKLILTPSMGGAILGGPADWVREHRVKIYDWRTFRKYTFNHQRYWWGRSPNGSDGGATDNLDVSYQGLITSLRVSAATAQDHPNYVSSPLIAAALLPVVQAMQNKRVYVLEQTIPDVAYDMAAGATLEVYFKGYVTSAAITTDDPTNSGLFTISMKPGSTDTALLARTSVSPGNIPQPLNMTITATGVDTLGASKTHTNDVRILPSVVGASSTLPVGATFPRDTVNAVKRWPRMSAAVSPFTDNGKFTVVICLKPGENATDMNLLVMGSKVIINRESGSNKLAIVIRDSAASTRVNWTTVTTNFTVANGETWVAFSVDLTAGTPVAVAYSGRNASDVDIGSGLIQPTAGTGLVGLASDPPNLFVSSASGPSTFTGSVKSVWVAQGVYFDFTNSANRRLFWNTDGTAVNLGSDGSTGTGVIPQVYFRGGPGDYVTGKNFGSGVDWTLHDNWLSGAAQSSAPTAY